MEVIEVFLESMFKDSQAFVVRSDDNDSGAHVSGGNFELLSQ